MRYTNADMPLLRVLLCYQISGRSAYYGDFSIYIVGLNYGLMSAYYYLISSVHIPIGLLGCFSLKLAGIDAILRCCTTLVLISQLDARLGLL